MAFCAKCGAQMAEGTTFCGACGAPVGGAAPVAAPVAAPPAANAGLTSNVAGCLAYVLGFITGIIFLILDPYKNDKFVRFHAFQSIFFNVVVIGFAIVWAILAGILGLISMGFLAGIMFLISFVIDLAFLAIWIFFMYKAYQNEYFKAPIIGELAAKQAGL
ncbi:MAG TPA: zinc-ribbon domain-containing protein [Terriglobia bacterium]|nr:zinc-ribbon domain-containing protein [Terriglobia bacterium]